MLVFICCVLSFVFSFFVGGGYNPVFMLYSCSNKEAKTLAVFGVCLVRAIIDVAMNVFWFTFPLYLAYLFALLVRNHASPYVTTFKSAFIFYFVSNSICFFQMSGLIPQFTTYPFSFTGYFMCMLAGLPFFIRSVLTSCAVLAVCEWLASPRGVRC